MWQQKVVVYNMKRRISRRAKSSGLERAVQRMLMEISAAAISDQEMDEELLEEVARVIGNRISVVCVSDRYARYRERLQDVQSHELFALRRLRVKASEFRVDLDPEGLAFWKAKLGDAASAVEEHWVEVVRRIKRRQWSKLRERCERELLKTFASNLRNCSWCRLYN